MFIKLKKLNFNSNIRDLERRGYKSYLFAMVNGQRCYIVGKEDVINKLSTMNRFPVTIEEERKIPLYKQAMQLQMGRQPKQTETERFTIMVQLLKNITPNVYNIWEISEFK